MTTEQRRGIDGFAEEADAWRAAVVGRVPSYHRVLEGAAALVTAPADPVEAAARERLEAAWRERRFSAGFDRPLLLMAALRAEAMRAGPAHPLHAALAAEPPDAGAATRAALAAALAGAPARLHVDLATRAVQTNETSRALAWLWPAHLCGCDGGARPLALADVGCSAGLNLTADALPAPWQDQAGAPLPVVRGARVVARLGFDARPLDVGRPEDVAWLRACVWPGEGARLARLDQAITAFRDAAAAGRPDAPRLGISDIADVGATLERAAAGLPPGTVFLAYQTVVRDYLPAAVRERHALAMRDWVAGGTSRVFVELEPAPDAWAGKGTDGPHPTPMAITAQIADAGADGGVRTLALGRCGYHPTFVVPDHDATAAFARLIRVGGA
jgi:hypothetical protein